MREGSPSTSRPELDVAVLGGGFAGVYCVKALARYGNALPNLRVGLISQENYMVFQPMLPEVAGGSVSPFHVVNPLRLLCKKAEVFNGRVEQIDWARRQVTLNAGAFSGNVTMRYRHLVLAVGAAINLTRIPGMSEHSLLLQNVGDAMRLRRTLISRMEEANLETRPTRKERLLTFVVVGGGFSGVETAGHILDLFRSIHSFYSAISLEDIQVYLVHSGDHLLPELSEKLGVYCAQKLRSRGLKIVFNQRVRAVTARRVHLQDGSAIETDTVICTVGNAPNPLIEDLCRTNDFEMRRGRIAVDSTCRVLGETDLWAVGDCADVPYVGGGSCPATAQFAVRQGWLVGHNLGRALTERPLRPFTFRGLGQLASLGHRTAVADVMGVQFSGFFAWWLWRTIYLLKLPRLDRKLRVVIDWTLDLFFPRDINLLNPRYSTLLREIYLEKGDYLFHKGEPAFSFYVVKKGRIELLDSEGLVEGIDEGEYFGERSLLTGEDRNFDARAAKPSNLVSIPANIFHQLVQDGGSLGQLFQKSAAKHQSRKMVAALLERIPSSIRSKTARELMRTDVDSLRPEMTFREVLSFLRERPHESYPVLDDSGLTLGVLYRRNFYDILKNQPDRLDRPLRDLPLSELPLLQDKVTCDLIMQCFVRTGSNKALIVDESGRLQGIITIVDIIPLDPA